MFIIIYYIRYTLINTDTNKIYSFKAECCISAKDESCVIIHTGFSFVIKSRQHPWAAIVLESTASDTSQG